MINELVVENPKLIECRAPSGAGYWRLSFDVKAWDAQQRVLLALYGVRVARGHLAGPRRQERGQEVATSTFHGPMLAAILDACRAAGWVARYPSVVWPC